MSRTTCRAATDPDPRSINDRLAAVGLTHRRPDAENTHAHEITDTATGQSLGWFTAGAAMDLAYVREDAALTARLAALGFTHTRDDQTDTDGRHTITCSADGAPVGRFTAVEACELLARYENPAAFPATGGGVASGSASAGPEVFMERIA